MDERKNDSDIVEKERVAPAEITQDQMQKEALQDQERVDPLFKQETAVADVAVAETAVADANTAAAADTAQGLPSTIKVYQPKKRNKFRYGCYLFFKRCFDVLTSGLMLLILSPIILLCLLIKWLEDFHSPVYVSKRVGKGGKTFKFYKIRTMCVGADKMKQALIDKGLNEADGPVFKIKNDPRITKFGKFLRRTSLDELLQLFNIFNGSMSVVGPRPPIPHEVEQYTPYQQHRLDVKGGLLCLWQIQKNRHDLSFDEWVRLDLEYIQTQSFWLDLKIIFKGAFMVLFDRSGE